MKEWEGNTFQRTVIALTKVLMHHSLNLYFERRSQIYIFFIILLLFFSVSEHADKSH